MRIIENKTEKIYVVRGEGADLNRDGDLSANAARKFIDDILQKIDYSQDWFCAGCERVNYDTVKVVYVEDR